MEKEYQIKIKAYYTGGFLPDFFGNTIIRIVRANSAKEIQDEVDKEFRFLPISYSLDIKLIG